MDYKKPQSTIVHGGAGIYPLTTADQVILADGSRLEKDGKISADSAANSAKLGGKSPEYYLQPRNLLDNSDFRNPVNQRGQTSTSGSWEFFIDRWRIADKSGNTVTATIEDGRIVFTSTADSLLIVQRLTKEVCPDITKTQFTAVAKTTDGELVFGTFKWFGDDNNFWQFEVSIPSGKAVEWCAAYEGEYTADTLPPYVPKGYAAELAECQRYYIEIGTQPVNGWCYDWGQVKVFVPTPKLMRQENPSVILNTASPNFYIGSTSYNATLIGGESISNGILVKYSHADTVRGQCIIPEFSAKIRADL